MSAQETSGSPGADHLDGAGIEHENNDEMASKLSKELSNWRRKRTSSRGRHVDIMVNSKTQSEPARTIKVRGHETLVIRKARPIVKQKND